MPIAEFNYLTDEFRQSLKTPNEVYLDIIDQNNDRITIFKVDSSFSIFIVKENGQTISFNTGNYMEKLTTVSLVTDSAVKQVLFTVAPGKKCIFTDIILRNPSQNLADLGEDSATIGSNSLANNIGVADVASLQAFNSFARSINADGYVVSGDEPDNTLGLKIANDSILSASFKVDVFGYYVD